MLRNKSRWVLLFVVLFSIALVCSHYNGSYAGEAVELDTGEASEFIPFSEIGIFDGDRVRMRFIPREGYEAVVYFTTEDIHHMYKENLSLHDVDVKRVKMGTIAVEETYVVPYDNEEWGIYIVNFYQGHAKIIYQVRDPPINVLESDLFMDIVTFCIVVALILNYLPQNIGFLKIWFAYGGAISAAYILVSHSSGPAEMSDFVAYFGVILVVLIMVFDEKTKELEKHSGEAQDVTSVSETGDEATSGGNQRTPVPGRSTADGDLPSKVGDDDDDGQEDISGIEVDGVPPTSTDVELAVDASCFR